MRTNIKIVGIGPRMAGTSKKNNNAYDFTPISIVFTDGKTAGHRAETINVNTGELPAGLALDAVFDCVLHPANNKYFIDAFL